MDIHGNAAIKSGRERGDEQGVWDSLKLSATRGALCSVSLSHSECRWLYDDGHCGEVVGSDDMGPIGTVIGIDTEFENECKDGIC